MEGSAAADGEGVVGIRKGHCQFDVDRAGSLFQEGEDGLQEDFSGLDADEDYIVARLVLGIEGIGKGAQWMGGGDRQIGDLETAILPLPESLLEERRSEILGFREAGEFLDGSGAFRFVGRQVGEGLSVAGYPEGQGFRPEFGDALDAALPEGSAAGPGAGGAAVAGCVEVIEESGIGEGGRPHVCFGWGEGERGKIEDQPGIFDDALFVSQAAVEAMAVGTGVQVGDCQIASLHPCECVAEQLGADLPTPIPFSRADRADQAGGDGRSGHPENAVAHAQLAYRPAVDFGDEQVIGIVPGLLGEQGKDIGIVADVLGERLGDDLFYGGIIFRAHRPAGYIHHSSSASEKATSASSGKMGRTHLW